MKPILETLNEAFVLLSTIPLAGDNLDTMAAAKTILREVYGQLKELDVKEGGA